METIFSPAHAGHAPAHEFLDGRRVDAFEVPTRADILRAAVTAAGLGPVRAPDDFGMAPIAAVHDAGYLEHLRTLHADWVADGRDPAVAYPDTFCVQPLVRRSAPPSKPGARMGFYTFDLSAGITAGTWAAALASAQCALTAASRVLDGAPAAFALCRPPGHHAHASLSGGYCYLNNAAIAAEWLVGRGAGRIAILDVDFHHGNGTQHLFYARDDVLFVSLHADPDRQYPYFLGHADETGAGRGRGFTRNLPLPAGIDDATYHDHLASACGTIAAFRPAALLVSLGVDTFGGDPLGDFALTGAAYGPIGARLAELGAPTVFLMEGGYAIRELGDNVVAVLKGFEAGRDR